MFSDKITQSIAEAAKKVMEEELKGNQHKIDANKNNKIDAHDFKLLRAKKKVEEEVEQLDELSPSLLKSYATKAKRDSKERFSKAMSEPDLDTKNIKKSQDRFVKASKAKSLADKRWARDFKEEVEQIDEKKYEPAEYNAAAAAARKKREENEERRREARENGEDKPTVRKVAGKAYGGAAQKDDEDMNEEFEQIEERVQGGSDPLQNRQDYAKKHGTGQVYKKTYPGDKKGMTGSYAYDIKRSGPKGKLPEGTVSFSDLIESYKEGGIKSLFKKIEEEVDNETFTKEFKDQKDKFDGKKKGADVAAPASQGVVDVKEETHTEVQVVDMTDGSQKPEITTIDLEEKTLTAGETAEKERIVKSMKKNLPSFKERYGERAKSVMYATATKMAKEEFEQIDETQNEDQSSMIIQEKVPLNPRIKGPRPYQRGDNPKWDAFQDSINKHIAKTSAADYEDYKKRSEKMKKKLRKNHEKGWPNS